MSGAERGPEISQQTPASAGGPASNSSPGRRQVRGLRTTAQSRHRYRIGEQWTDREILDIYHDYPCHKCGFPFPVVDAGWLNDDDLGRRIQERFPAFYKDYSHRLRQAYWTNHCPSCGAIQGSYWITESTFDREPDDSLIIAPWRPRKTEEREVGRETIEWGNFHHVDENPSNNNLENIRLLCVRCHADRHKRSRSKSSVGDS
jgi:hypothetical protein